MQSDHTTNQIIQKFRKTKTGTGTSLNKIAKGLLIILGAFFVVFSKTTTENEQTRCCLKNGDHD